ncbi:class I SAM-dependent methyltransferase, partial [Streptococcus suis]
YYDMIEQNSAYVSCQHEKDLFVNNNKTLKKLDLTNEEWRRDFQFLIIKANQTEHMQDHNQFKTDSIGFILSFLVDH